MRKIITLLYLYILCYYGLSQEWVNYTNYNSIYDIVNHQDVLWIATHGGLVKFNIQSEEIEYFNRANSGIPDNLVAALALDAAGNIWLGTQRYGVGKFDGKNCTIFNTDNSGIPHDQWNHAIAADNQGNMWISSLRYLSKYDGINWSVYETGSPISSYIALHDIQVDKHGTVWIGASWGLGKFAGDSLIQGFVGLAQDIKCIAFGKNETMWLGTDGSGLIKVDGENKTFYNTTNSDIPSDIVYSAKIDSKDILWLATGKGLVSFDGASWQVYNTANSGLLENVIFTLEIDEADKIWLGLMSKGLMSYDGVKFKSFFLGNSGFPTNSIYDIEFDTNELPWFATYKGLVKFDYDEWLSFDCTNSGLRNPFILALALDLNSNTLWIGSRDSFCLSKYDSENWVVYDSTNSILKKEWVEDIEIGPLGNLWIATRGGLVKFDGENWFRYSMENTPLTSNTLGNLVFDSFGNLWIALRRNPFLNHIGGVANFDGQNWTIYTKENSDYPYYSAGFLAFDSLGILWIAVDEGLVRFDGQNWSTNSTFNWIQYIYVDSLNFLWLGTVKFGLIRYDRNDKWIVYNTSNSGISSNKISSINIDSKGNKWMAHFFSGISVFREGGVLITDTADRHPTIPNKFALCQNYPNPFNDQTIISYYLPKPAFVDLIIYNTLGKKVRTLVNSPQSKGDYKLSWDGLNDSGRKSASGLYLYILQINNTIKSRKMVLLK